MMRAIPIGRPWFTVGLSVILAFGCADSAPPPLDRAAHEADVESWRQHRLNLLYDEGWLALTGLYWLEEGESTFGGGEENDLVFPGHDVPERIGVLSVRGDTVSVSVSPGVEVRHEGEPVREMTLRRDGDGETKVLTSGSLAWFVLRFIWVDAPQDGDRVIIDFNRAYNPPCVFTPHATCPLPPRQNRLPVRIEAGEIMYQGGVH